MAAVDLSPEAIAVAERNVADYRLSDRIELIHSDAFQNLAGRKFDLIVSNPLRQCRSVAACRRNICTNPELALGSGEDGLDFTRIILREAKKHLTDNGILIVEIGHNRDASGSRLSDAALHLARYRRR